MSRYQVKIKISPAGSNGGSVMTYSVDAESDSMAENLAMQQARSKHPKQVQANDSFTCVKIEKIR